MTGFLLIVLLVSNQVMTVVKLCNLKDGEFNIRSSGCLKELLTELRSKQSNQEQIKIKIHGLLLLGGLQTKLLHNLSL